MKRTLSVLIAVSVLLSLVGCSGVATGRSAREPVNFYYGTPSIERSDTDRVIDAEVRDAHGHTDDLEYLLGLYLDGPVNYGLITPFPAGTSLKAVAVDGEGVTLILSNHIAKLSDYNATLAYACLYYTVSELVGVDTVTIQAESALINDSAYITLTADSFAFVAEK